MTLVIAEYYMSFTKPLALLIQASQESTELVELLKGKRTDDSVFQELFQKASMLAEELDVEVKAPRRAVRQQNRPKAPAETVEEYFRSDMRNIFWIT